MSKSFKLTNRRVRGGRVDPDDSFEERISWNMGLYQTGKVSEEEAQQEDADYHRKKLQVPNRDIRQYNPFIEEEAQRPESASEDEYEDRNADYKPETGEIPSDTGNDAYAAQKLDAGTSKKKSSSKKKAKYEKKLNKPDRKQMDENTSPIPPRKKRAKVVYTDSE